MQREGWLLSAGETWVVRRLLALPAPALALYARLSMRKGDLFRIEELAYREVPDPRASAALLVEAELARFGERVLSEQALAASCSVEELRAACRALGLRCTGRRAELLASLDGQPVRPLLSRPLLLLRHGGLVARLTRLYLGSRHADLQRMVLHRISVHRYPRYTPTPGSGLFPDRRSLLAWERGLAVDQQLGSLPAVERSAALQARLDEDLDLATAGPPPPEWRARRTARHLAAGRVVEAARALERLGQPARAAEVYTRLVQAQSSTEGELQHRRALALEAAGRPEQALRLCREELERVDASTSLALARTGRRLARALGQGFAPLPPLRSPPLRRLRLPLAERGRLPLAERGRLPLAERGRLPLAERGGLRPLWTSPAGPLPLEPAIQATLAAHGRASIHAEGGLWLCLFGMLFAEAILAPVPGMLPSPLRTAPLDLGSAGFSARREAWIQPVLHGLRAGEGAERLAEVWRTREGEALAGVAWGRFPLELLQTVARDLGGATLAAVLQLVAEDWRQAPRGLPDLIILAGPELRLPDAFPARLPSTALMAEIKGPGDQLRDSQRLWLDRLLAAGVATELWLVDAAPTSVDGR